jgi:hypothetical protein
MREKKKKGGKSLLEKIKKKVQIQQYEKAHLDATCYAHTVSSTHTSSPQNTLGASESLLDDLGHGTKGTAVLAVGFRGPPCLW